MTLTLHEIQEHNHRWVQLQRFADCWRDCELAHRRAAQYAPGTPGYEAAHTEILRAGELYIALYRQMRANGQREWMNRTTWHRRPYL